MTAAENAARLMEALAADDSHGYDQAFRWGPDYDCSSAVITVWEQAGIPVKAAGATYTGNMYRAFLSCGFEDVTAAVELASGEGLKRGDVLLNHKNHTAIYCGEGKTAEACINEHGTVSGGESGDQSGREFYIRPYRNYPWDCVLRYAEQKEAPGLPELSEGDVGPAVSMMQGALKYYGHDPLWVDGDFGQRTRRKLVEFQTRFGLEPDGICGALSWARLLKG